MKMFILPIAACLLAAAAPAPFMPDVVSTAANEYNLSVTRDGLTMVFARSQANFAAAQILIMEKRGDSWSTPQRPSFSDGQYRDSDPWLTPDGRWLYFISDRPAPARTVDRDDFDIWRVARRPDGTWATPEHIAEVSSPGEELGPELHGAALYFNSTRRGGPGNLDIYTAPQRADGHFDAPSPLSEPINSSHAEGDFTLSADGTRAFFWSTRSGKAHLWSVQRVGGTWAVPQPVDSVNEGPFVFTPSLIGDRLAYASIVARKGQPSGMADIYIVQMPEAPARSQP